MRPADIVLQNDSKQEVRLTHTSLANAGKTSAYRGTPSCWKTPPPNSGLCITPGKSSKAGTMDSVMLCDNSSWIFVQYQGSKTILQVFVAMKASGFFSSRGSGIWADIGPYDPQSTESNPMPHGKRMELIAYTLSEKPNCLVTVHIPPIESWAYLIPSPATLPKKGMENSQLFLSELLELINTIRIPAPSYVTQDTSGWFEPESATTKLTVTPSFASKLSALLDIAQSGLDAFFHHCFRQMHADVENKRTGKESTGNKLRLQIDEKEAGFLHRGGICNRLRSIASNVQDQLESTNTADFHRNLLQDTKQCLTFLRSITEENSAFRRAFISCLDELTDASTTALQKVSLELISKGLHMTLDAFLNGYALRSFIRRARNADEMEDELKLNEFDADSVYDYLGRTVRNQPCSQLILTLKVHSNHR